MIHGMRARSIGFGHSFVKSLVVLGFSAFTAASAADAAEISQTYNLLCSGCHGANLEGGQTDSMLDDVWKHGGDDADLAKAIRDGFELQGMPGWKGELNEAQIRAMVVFIREKRAEASRRATTIAKPTDQELVQSREHAFRLRTVVDGLDTPWSMAFLPDGRWLVTELKGRLRVVENGRLLPEAVAGTPQVLAAGQGGLMEVALHPDYSKNGWIYLAYSDAAPGDRKDMGLTVVVRGRIKDNRWAEEQTIYRAPYELYRPGGVHFGCRLVFDRSGYLFFSIGERGHKEDAQNIARPNGKIHRIHDDGRIPADNPFVGRTNALASIWTYGNRNPQGLDLHPVTGELWETEHGPRGGDELNLILKGRNYGWPVITYGIDYNGTPISDLTEKAGMEQPVIHWTPSIAVCGIDFYEGNRFPKWKNSLFVTALAQQELRRVVLEGHRVTDQEVLFKNIGRLRDVACGPDGFLYVLLNKPDKIVRLEPAE